MEEIRARGTDKAKVIEVIQTKSLIGSGTKEDPARCIYQYWDFKGNLLAQNDAQTENKLPRHTCSNIPQFKLTQ